jgi:hypothetical protein
LFSYINLNPVKLIEPKWKEKGIQNKNKIYQYLQKYNYSSFIDLCKIKRPESVILSLSQFPEYFNIREDFVKLLKSKNNRLVWGAMIALAEVAKVDPDVVFKNLDFIKKAKEIGSVITIDNAISVLALTASADLKYNKVIFPYLLSHLSSCRPKEVPQHAERTFPAVNSSNKSEFIKLLEKRTEDLSGGGLTRVKKIIKQAAAIA